MIPGKEFGELLLKFQRITGRECWQRRLVTEREEAKTLLMLSSISLIQQLWL